MDSEVYHIMPIDDLYPHFMKSTCPCVPQVLDQENGRLVIHNSYDGREIIEKIEADLNG